MGKTSKQMEVLVVDDDLGHASLIKINLRKGGLKAPVTHFTDGTEFVKFSRTDMNRSNRKYLMLLDLNMPGMDGYKLLKYIKSSEELSTMPIVVLTTTSNEDEISNCYSLGCNLYLTKNTEYEQFASTIKSLGQLISRISLI